jgi:hypothetical protein
MHIRTTVVCLAFQLVAPMSRLGAQEATSPPGDVQARVVTPEPTLDRPSEPQPVAPHADSIPSTQSAAEPTQAALPVQAPAPQPGADLERPTPNPVSAVANQPVLPAQPIMPTATVGDAQLAPQRFAVELTGGSTGTRLTLNGVSRQAGPMRVDNIDVRADIAGNARDQPQQLAQDAQGRAQFDLPRGGGTFILKQASSEPTVLGGVGTLVALPMLIVDAQPKPGGRGLNVVMGTPMLQMSHQIDWDPKSRAYVVDYLFWVASSNLADAALSRPAWATFTSNCSGATPLNQVITRLGQESAVHISVSCTAKDKKASAQHDLYLSLGKSTEKVPFQLPELQGTPTLEASPASVYGFGLQKIRVTVKDFGVDGNALKETEDTTFNLNFEAFDGDVPPVKILTGSSEGTVEIRPRGLGRLSFYASGSDRKTEKQSVELRWPITLLIAVVLGGGLGGCISLFGKGQRNRLVIRTAEGVLVALLACALFVIFPELISLDANQSMSEIVVFGLSGASGFVGATLIDRVTKVLFRLPAAASEVGKSSGA